MSPASSPPSRSLLAAKSFYFLYFGAWACLSPFLALYYRGLGFNGSQIGLLTSLSPFTTLFAASLWSAAADVTRRHRAILLIAIAGSGISVAALSLVRTFWAAIPLVIAFSFFTAPVIPLIDNSVLAQLGERRDLYGRQRLWGAIGWGVTGLVTGWLVGIYGTHAAFPAFLVFISLLFGAAWFLSVTQTERSQPFWHGVRGLLTDRRWILFLCIIFLGGTGMSIINNYLFLYLAEIQAPAALMGLSLSLATISELPVLFFSGWMLRRWGPRGLLIISLAAYILRAGGYAIATQPWQALLLQLFHGLSFSAMWVAGVSFAGEIAPEGFGATAQGLFSSTVMGLGGIGGAFLGGLLLDQIGGAGVFRVSAMLVSIGLILLLVGGRVLTSRNHPPA
jgi:MFS transporter, PPP family, 3-phenylpropionic acid transporter